MIKHLTAALAASLLLALPAAAQGSERLSTQGASAMPPSNSAQRTWTSPQGCRYSRAGRPGEVVWFIITNTRRPGCPTYIVQRSIDGIYDR